MLSAQPLGAEYRAVRKTSGDEAWPAVSLGRCVRLHRTAKKLNQIQLARKAGMSNNQLSLLEKGKNVEVEQYQRVARALEFRDALDMFRAATDPLMRRVWRYWPLLDEAARKDVLRQVRKTIEADVGSDATSAVERDAD
jgi:transcriptional regulator with XRE-family HTH domain